MSINFDKNGILWILFAISTPSNGIRSLSGFDNTLHNCMAYALIYMLLSYIISKKSINMFFIFSLKEIFKKKEI